MNQKKFHSCSSSPINKDLYYSLSIKNLNINEKLNSNKKRRTNKIIKSNILKVQQILKQNNEINSLNDKIRLSKINSFEKENKINQSLTSRKKLSNEKKTIANYCSILLYRNLHLDQTKSIYENSIKELKDDYYKTSNEYDNKIEEIAKINNNIKKKINDGLILFDKQKKEIIENKVKIKIFEKKLFEQEKIILDREKFYKERYNTLKKKYNNLQIKLSEIYDKLSDSGNYLYTNNISQYNYEKINKKKINNNTNELIKKIGELNKTICNIKSNFSSEDYFDLQNNKKSINNLSKTKSN